MKCKICGKEFELLIAYRYTSTSIAVSGLATIFTGSGEKLYDTFDCPYCGCQNTVQERKIKFVEKSDDYFEDDTEYLESNEENMEVLRKAKEELESGGGVEVKLCEEDEYEPVDIDTSWIPGENPKCYGSFCNEDKEHMTDCNVCSVKDECKSETLNNLIKSNDAQPNCIGDYYKCKPDHPCSIRTHCKEEADKKDKIYRSCEGCKYELKKTDKCIGCFPVKSKEAHPIRKNYKSYEL